MLAIKLGVNHVCLVQLIAPVSSNARLKDVLNKKLKVNSVSKYNIFSNDRANR